MEKNLSHVLRVCLLAGIVVDLFYQGEVLPQLQKVCTIKSIIFKLLSFKSLCFYSLFSCFRIVRKENFLPPRCERSIGRCKRGMNSRRGSNPEDASWSTAAERVWNDETLHLIMTTEHGLGKMDQPPGMQQSQHWFAFSPRYIVVLFGFWASQDSNCNVTSFISFSSPEWVLF